MAYLMKLEKDSNEEDCATFYTSEDEDNDILCVRYRDLARTGSIKLLDSERLNLDNVLVNLIRLADRVSEPEKENKHGGVIWKLTNLIQEKHPDLDADVLADSFLGIEKIIKLNQLSEEFKKTTPVEKYPGTTFDDEGSWNKKFLAFLEEKGFA